MMDSNLNFAQTDVIDQFISTNIINENTCRVLENYLLDLKQSLSLDMIFEIFDSKNYFYFKRKV
jgi:hypothetical protein